MALVDVAGVQGGNEGDQWRVAGQALAQNLRDRAGIPVAITYDNSLQTTLLLCSAVFADILHEAGQFEEGCADCLTFTLGVLDLLLLVGVGIIRAGHYFLSAGEVDELNARTRVLVMHIPHDEAQRAHKMASGGRRVMAAELDHVAGQA